jgi:hypothetical protein
MKKLLLAPPRPPRKPVFPPVTLLSVGLSQIAQKGCWPSMGGKLRMISCGNSDGREMAALRVDPLAARRAGQGGCQRYAAGLARRSAALRSN